MKNWNKIGKTKAIILAILSLPNLLVPIGANPPFSISMIFMPLIFGSLAIPLISRVNAAMGMEIAKPNWNDNPLKLNKPLSFFNFFACFFIVAGMSIIVGTAIKYQRINNFSLTFISFGIGIYIGIWIALKWMKK